MPNQNLSDEEVRAFIAYFNAAAEQDAIRLARRSESVGRGRSGKRRKGQRKAMKRLLIAIVMTFAGGTPAASLACGACDEDKVAATYDHAVIDAAMARHQRVVFV